MKLADVRSTYGFTQREMAAVLQIGRSTYAAAETGNLPLPVTAVPWVVALNASDNFAAHQTAHLRALASSVADGLTPVTRFWRNFFQMESP